jgi:type I restriction enzyme S subunit
MVQSSFIITPVGEIPCDWSATKLGDAAYIKARIGWRGLSSKEYTESGPYLIAGNHIKGSRICWDEVDHISDFRYEESPEIQLRADDVVISKDGTIGRVGFIEELPDRATINGTMMLVRPDQQTLVPKFVYYYLQGHRFQRLVRERVSGSSVPHLFQRDMVGIWVPVPSLTEQRKIAAILSSVDEAIEKTQAVIDQMQVVKKGLMQELLTRGCPAHHTRFKHTEIGESPEEWEVTTLGELAGFVTSGSRGWAKYYAENGALFIRSQNVRAGVLDLGDSAFVKPPTGAEGSRTRVLANDVLITITGNSVGNVAYAPEGLREAYVSQHVGLIRLKQPELAPYVTQYFSPGAPGNWQILAAQYGQSKPGLNLTDLRSLVVPLPSAKEREQIAGGLLSLQTRIDVEQDFKGGLESLKHSLMSSLLSGEIRVI